MAASDDKPSPDHALVLDGVGRADVKTTVAQLKVEGIELLGAGDYESAVARLSEAKRLLLRSRTLNATNASTFAWLASAQRQTAIRVPRLAPSTFKRRLRGARRSSAQAIAVGLLYPRDLPHALREAALVRAFNGRLRTARWMFDRSLSLALKQHAEYEIVETLATREHVSQWARWPAATEHAATTATTLASSEATTNGRSEGERGSVALAHRYDALLHAARRVISASSMDELHQSVTSAATSLLRAECNILPGGPGTPASRWQPLPATHVDDVARDLILQSLRSGAPSVADTDTDSVLIAPILSAGEAVAFIHARHQSVPRLFGKDEQQLASFLTAIAGAAFERVLLQRDVMEAVIAAQENERARVSRDLHDEVGSGLTSILLGLGMLSKQAVRPELEERASDLRVLINRLLAQVRRLAFDLRPTVLDDLGLGAALSLLTTDVANRHGLEVVVEASALEELPRLAPGLEGTIYRVVQEALDNVVRHAGASECSVLVASDGHRLRTIVEDDGTGFDLLAIGTATPGFRRMRERAALADATLVIDSSPDAGTSVMLEVGL